MKKQPNWKAATKMANKVIKEIRQEADNDCMGCIPQEDIIFAECRVHGKQPITDNSWENDSWMDEIVKIIGADVDVRQLTELQQFIKSLLDKQREEIVGEMRDLYSFYPKNNSRKELAFIDIKVLIKNLDDILEKLNQPK